MSYPWHRFARRLALGATGIVGLTLVTPTPATAQWTFVESDKINTWIPEYGLWLQGTVNWWRLGNSDTRAAAYWIQAVQPRGYTNWRPLCVGLKLKKGVLVRSTSAEAGAAVGASITGPSGEASFSRATTDGPTTATQGFYFKCPQYPYYVANVASGVEYHGVAEGKMEWFSAQACMRLPPANNFNQQWCTPIDYNWFERN